MKHMKRLIAAVLAFAIIAMPTQTAKAQTSEEYVKDGELTPAEMVIEGGKVYYPAELTSMDVQLPVIVWGNGTICWTSLYTGFLNHFASRGYIIVATDNTMNEDGKDMLASLDRLLAMGEDETSIFYHKIDVNNIGAMGHSQGGAGSISCAYDSRIKCIAPIQATYVDPKGIKDTPMFLIAGGLDFIVMPIAFCQRTYNDATGPAIYATKWMIGHTCIMTDAKLLQGYLTAWFDYYLKSDTAAGANFFGEHCTLEEDKDWTNFQRKNFE